MDMMRFWKPESACDCHGIVGRFACTMLVVLPRLVLVALCVSFLFASLDHRLCWWLRRGWHFEQGVVSVQACAPLQLWLLQPWARDIAAWGSGQLAAVCMVVSGQ